MKSLLVICVFLLIANVQSSRVRRQAPIAAAAPPALISPLTGGMQLALNSVLNDLEAARTLGGPVNPTGLKKATFLALKIELLGDKVDSSTQDKLDTLTAAYILETAQSPYAQYLANFEAGP